MSRPEKRLVPVKPPRRKTTEMGVHEIIPPALQNTEENPSSLSPQPGDARRVSWNVMADKLKRQGDRSPDTSTKAVYDSTGNTLGLNPNFDDETAYPHELGHAMWDLNALPKTVMNQWDHIHTAAGDKVDAANELVDDAILEQDALYKEYLKALPANWNSLSPEAQMEIAQNLPQSQEYLAARDRVHELRRLSRNANDAIPTFIRNYPDDPSHSWADAVGEYIGEPERMESKYPWIYRWMRSVLGREYKTRDAAEAQSPAAHVPFYWGTVDK